MESIVPIAKKSLWYVALVFYSREAIPTEREFFVLLVSALVASLLSFRTVQEHVPLDSKVQEYVDPLSSPSALAQRLRVRGLPQCYRTTNTTFNQCRTNERCCCSSGVCCDKYGRFKVRSTFSSFGTLAKSFSCSSLLAKSFSPRLRSVLHRVDLVNSIGTALEIPLTARLVFAPRISFARRVLVAARTTGSARDHLLLVHPTS